MKHYIYRASRSAYLILCGPWILFSLFYVALSVQKQDLFIAPIIISASVGLTFGIWLYMFKLELNNNEIIYHSFFNGHVRLSLNSIKSMNDISKGPISKTPLRSVFGIEGKDGLKINWKVFPKDAGSQLSEIIKTRTK